MRQSQPSRMQRLPPEPPQRRREGLITLGGQAQAASVHGIPHQGMTDMGHVHPDLMGTPGFQLHSDQGMGPVTFQNAIVSDGRPPARYDGHSLAFHGMSTDGRVHRPAGDQHALHDRVVFTPQCARLELLHQALAGSHGPRHHQHEAAGVLVQAMHDAGPGQARELGGIVQ